MDQQAEAILRDWYWTQKQKDSDIKLFEALKKLGLYKYGIGEYTRPTMREIIKGTALQITNPGYDKWVYLTKFNKECPIGFTTDYYDGLHCSINIWPLQITWTI